MSPPRFIPVSERQPDIETKNSKRTEINKPKHVRRKRKVVFKDITKRTEDIKIPKKLIKQRQRKILQLYSQGNTPDQIALKLDMQTNHVRTNINNAIDDMVQHWATPTPQANFVRYASFQFGIIKKLDCVFEDFQNDLEQKQYTAAVSALRTQSDIYDKVLEKGKEFGVVKQGKASDTIRQAPANIRVELRKEIVVLSKLLNELDDTKQINQLKKSGIQTKTSISFVINKPLRNSKGIIFEIGDFREKQYGPGTKVLDINKVIESEITDDPIDTLLGEIDKLNKERKLTPPIIESTPLVTEPTVSVKQSNWLIEPKK